MSNQGKYDYSQTYVGFAHIIYALIIGLSYETLKTAFIPFQISFHLFTVFLAYAVVVQSWIGYNQAVHSHSYKGSLKFIIDLVILFLMFLLLSFSVGEFANYITIFPIIFFFLMIWRYGTIRDNYKRQGWKKTVKALKLVLAYVITSSLVVIIYELIAQYLNLETRSAVNFVVLEMLYIEVFFYYRLRKFDRISTYLTAKPVSAANEK